MYFILVCCFFFLLFSRVIKCQSCWICAFCMNLSRSCALCTMRWRCWKPKAKHTIFQENGQSVGRHSIAIEMEMEIIQKRVWKSINCFQANRIGKWAQSAETATENRMCIDRIQLTSCDTVWFEARVLTILRQERQQMCSLAKRMRLCVSDILINLNAIREIYWGFFPSSLWTMLFFFLLFYRLSHSLCSSVSFESLHFASFVSLDFSLSCMILSALREINSMCLH